MSETVAGAQMPQMDMEKFAREMGCLLSANQGDPPRFIEDIFHLFDHALLSTLRRSLVTQQQETLREQMRRGLEEIYDRVSTLATPTYTDPLTREPGASIWIQE